MKEPAHDERILSFNLFGESDELPDVVHCEAIRTRSRLHEWELAPHRHGRLHQVLLVESGGGQANLEGRSHALGAGVLVNVPAGNVHAFSFVPGTEGWVVTLAAEMLDEVLVPAEGLRPVLAHASALAAEPTIRMLMAQVFTEFAGRGYGRAQILRGLAAALLGEVARTLARDHATPGGLADSDLLHRFELLLEAHFLAHWTVADYARELAVTPTHLSRLARAATGQPASRLIEERMIREARRNLVFTNLPVTTIAYTLGFSDPAYFSRVFSRATGRSPTAFRSQLGG